MLFSNVVSTEYTHIEFYAYVLFAVGDMWHFFVHLVESYTFQNNNHEVFSFVLKVLVSVSELALYLSVRFGVSEYVTLNVITNLNYPTCNHLGHIYVNIITLKEFYSICLYTWLIHIAYCVSSCACVHKNIQCKIAVQKRTMRRKILIIRLMIYFTSLARSKLSVLSLYCGLIFFVFLYLPAVKEWQSHCLRVELFVFQAYLNISNNNNMLVFLYLMLGARINIHREK